MFQENLETIQKYLMKRLECVSFRSNQSKTFPTHSQLFYISLNPLPLLLFLLFQNLMMILEM